MRDKMFWDAKFGILRNPKEGENCSQACHDGDPINLWISRKDEKTLTFHKSELGYYYLNGE